MRQGDYAARDGVAEIIGVNMDTRIADLKVVADAAEFYIKRVRIQYQSGGYKPAITLKIQAVKGTNNGRYSVIRPQESDVGT